MINSFQTEFDTRTRKNQQEVLFEGESVDLVACLTRDGVPLDLAGCTVTALYQPESMKGKSDDWYAVPAEIQENRVIVHWDVNYQMASDRKYYIYALVVNVQDEDVAYPCSWILELANSPDFPVNPIYPIPKMLDFSQYTLVNDPWLRVNHVDPNTDEVDKDVNFTGTVTIENLSIADQHLQDQIDDIQDKVTETNTKVALEETSQDIKGRLTNPTTGLGAIKATVDATNTALPSLATGTAVAAVSTALGDPTNGLESIKASAAAAATSAAANNALLTDATYGLEHIYNTILTDGQWAQQCYNYMTDAPYSIRQGNRIIQVVPHRGFPTVLSNQETIQGLLENQTYGLSAIKTAVDAITIPTDYAKETTAQSALGQATTAATNAAANNNLLTNNTYGLSALKSAVTLVNNNVETWGSLIKSQVDNKSDLYAWIQALYGAVVSDDTLATIYNMVGSMTESVVDIANAVEDLPEHVSQLLENTQDVPERLAAINGMLDSEEYGLEAIKDAVDAIVPASGYATQAQAASIISKLDNQTNGLAAIKTSADAGAIQAAAAADTADQVKRLLNNSSTGLGAIWQQANNARSFAQSAYTSIVNQNYGLQATKAVVDAINTTVTANNGILADQEFGLEVIETDLLAAKGILTNGTYGNQAIRNAIDNTYNKADAALTQATAAATQATTAATQSTTAATQATTAAQKSTANNNLLTDATYGLEAIQTAVADADGVAGDIYNIVAHQAYGNSAIKSELDTVATDTSSAKLAAQSAATSAGANHDLLVNQTYGLEAIKNAIGGIIIPSDYATSTQATSIINKLDDGTNGLAAIKTSAAAAATDAATVKTAVQDSTNGLAAIKTQAATAATQATTAATKASSVESVVTNQTYGNSALKTRLDILYDGDYGLQTLKGTADDAFTAANECWVILNDNTYGNSAIKSAINTANTKLDNSTYGLSAIKTAVNTVDARITDGTNGLAAIKTQATTAATQSTTAATQSTTAATQATTAATKSTANNTLLTDSTNGLAAIKDYVSDTDYGLPKVVYDLYNINDLLTGPDGLQSISSTVASCSGDLDTIQGILGTGHDSGGNYADMTEFLDGIHGEVGDVYTRVETTKNVVTNATYGNQAIKNALTDSTNGLAAIKTQAASATTQAQNAYNIVNNATYGNSAIKTAIGTTNARLDDQTIGLQAIKNAVTAITIPNDYATNTQATTIINTVNHSTYGNQALGALLGDCAAALDVINGEVL